VTALYGYVGVPEMGLGFRQGISGFELEARARLDYFRLAGIFDGGVRRQVLVRGDLSLAAALSLGLVLNSGSEYLDEDNFPSAMVRISPGAVAGWRVAETVTMVGLVDQPIDLGLSPSGARRFQALAGGGLVHVGREARVGSMNIGGAKSGVMDSDRQVMALLDQAAVSYGLVLTKADELKSSERPGALAAAGKEAGTHTAALAETQLTSAVTGEGIPELRGHLAALAQ